MPKPPAAKPPAQALPVATSEPGSRTASMFFDDYPLFYGTSKTAASEGRLNLRYEAIFEQNRDLFAGARVLDIASHDGRWSLAALACGAESVIGIEARPELCEQAAESLATYGYGADRARFLNGDVHEVLATADLDVDVVLCLGFLYHTLRYNELMHGIRRANPRHLIIDTQAQLMHSPRPLVRLRDEKDNFQGNAVPDALSHGTSVLTGRPNLAAIDVLLGSYGFRTERLSDWPGILRDNPGVTGARDYARQLRTTVRCVNTERVEADAQRSDTAEAVGSAAAAG